MLGTSSSEDLLGQEALRKSEIEAAEERTQGSSFCMQFGSCGEKVYLREGTKRTYTRERRDCM